MSQRLTAGRMMSPPALRAPLSLCVHWCLQVSTWCMLNTGPGLASQQPVMSQIMAAGPPLKIRFSVIAEIERRNIPDWSRGHWILAIFCITLLKEWLDFK